MRFRGRVPLTRDEITFDIPFVLNGCIYFLFVLADTWEPAWNVALCWAWVARLLTW
jgi:hypothetical protein